VCVYVPDGEGGHAGHKGKGLAEHHGCWLSCLCALWWTVGGVRWTSKKRMPWKSAIEIGETRQQGQPPSYRQERGKLGDHQTQHTGDRQKDKRRKGAACAASRPSQELTKQASVPYSLHPGHRG
jgi:hypothetical protein